MTEKKRLNVSLPREFAKRFKAWCNDMHIKWDSHEYYDEILIYTEVDEEERKVADAFIDSMYAEKEAV